jgi:hypothetical protein
MAIKKYLALLSGRVSEESPVDTSAGAGDAGKVVALDTGGKIAQSMMPTGVGADTAVRVASENLAAGDFVNYWNDAGTLKVRKADATASGKEADGYVIAAVTSGQNATVYHEGTNNQLSGLTLGARYYLSAATAGTPTATPPSTAGNVVQYLGRAISATELVYEADDGVILV